MFTLDHSYWEIKTTPHKGKGVFAKKEIPPGTVFGDYLGKFIDSDNDDLYEKKYGLYVFAFSNKLSIFPNIGTEGIHLINNSCAPNIAVVVYKYHVIYYASRKIFPNEELTISYSLAPPSGKVEQTNPCYCGTIICRGTMNVSEAEDSENEKDYQDKPNDLQYSPGDIFPPLSNYPSKFKFDQEEDFFGYEKEKPYDYDDEKFPDILTIKKTIYKTGRMIRVTKHNVVIYGVRRDIVYALSNEKIKELLKF